MKNQEIKWYDDYDWDTETYYEVELWAKGLDSRYFRTEKAAKNCLAKNRKTPYDCIKKHIAGDCYII